MREPCAIWPAYLEAMKHRLRQNVKIAGETTYADLDLCRDTQSFILCDIKGGEDALLNPAKVPGLAFADILVEVHDCFYPNLSDKIADRFKETDEIEKIHRGMGMADGSYSLAMDAVTRKGRLGASRFLRCFVNVSKIDTSCEGLAEMV